MRNHLLMGIFGVLATASITAHPVWAGADKEGNGGMSVVCRSARGTITFAQLLDLYEAENDPRLDMKIARDTHGTIEDQISAARDRLASVNENAAIDLLYFLTKIRGNQKTIHNPEVGAAMPDDFHPRVTLKNPLCRLEPAATYFPDGIQWDNEIVSAMPLTDQAALYVHESLYLAARENRKATNSDGIRLLVATLFASEVDTAKISTLVSGELMERSNPDFARYIARARGDDTSLEIGMGVVDTVRIDDALYTFYISSTNELIHMGSVTGCPYYKNDLVCAYSNVKGSVKGRLAFISNVVTIPKDATLKVTIAKELCHIQDQLLAVTIGSKKQGYQHKTIIESLLDFNNIETSRRISITIVTRSANW